MGASTSCCVAKMKDSVRSAPAGVCANARFPNPSSNERQKKRCKRGGAKLCAQQRMDSGFASSLSLRSTLLARAMTRRAHITKQLPTEPLTPRHLVEVVVEHHHLSPAIRARRVISCVDLRSKANRMRGFVIAQKNQFSNPRRGTRPQRDTKRMGETGAKGGEE